MTLPPVLVLTAGLGTRIRPLSYVRAKPAMPVAGQPLVCRILAWLASHGFRDIVLNLHFKPETITAVVGDGSNLGVRVRYSPEDPILGSGGGPRQALTLLNAGRLLVVNGDTLCDVDLGALIAQHQATKALVTMAVVPQPDPTRYGGVNADAHGVVTGFTRRGSPSAYHFVGIQAAEAEAFAKVPAGTAAETVAQIYPQLMAERPGCIRTFVSDARFRDIGTALDYLHTSLDLARAEGVAIPVVGRGSVIYPSARVTDCVLWDDVVVAPDAALTRCVVADDVRIPPGAAFEDTAIVRCPAGHAPLAGEEIRGDLLMRRM